MGWKDCLAACLASLALHAALAGSAVLCLGQPDVPSTGHGDSGLRVRVRREHPAHHWHDFEGHPLAPFGSGRGCINRLRTEGAEWTGSECDDFMAWLAARARSFRDWYARAEGRAIWPALEDLDVDVRAAGHQVIYIEDEAWTPRGFRKLLRLRCLDHGSTVLLDEF